MQCEECGFLNPDRTAICRYCDALIDQSVVANEALSGAARDFATNQLSDDEYEVLGMLSNRRWIEPWSAKDSEVVHHFNRSYDEFLENEDLREDDRANINTEDTARTLYDDYNIIERVQFTGGIIGLFVSDETNLQDCVDRLNRDGYRVTLMLPASHTVLSWIGSLILLIVTLFLYTRLPGYIVIGELIADPTVP